MEELGAVLSQDNDRCVVVVYLLSRNGSVVLPSGKC